MFSGAKAIFGDLIAFLTSDMAPKDWLSDQVQTVLDFQLHLLQSIIWIRCMHLDDLLCIDRNLFG